MATKVSNFTPSDALDGTEIVPLIQGGSNKRTTVQDIANRAAGGVTIDDAVPATDKVFSSSKTKSLVDSEATARNDADSTLASAIADESTARQTEDTNLQNIKADKTYVDTADAALQSQINDLETATKPTGTQRISGCQESWSGTGLTFDVTPGTYKIQGAAYTFAGDSKTLAAADATYGRFDVLALNDQEQLIVITGTPGANPDIPQVDPDTQLYLTAIFVDAGATTPTGIDQSIIYSENAEWTGSTSNMTADFNDTSAPFQGTKDIYVSSASNNGYLALQNSSALQVTDFSLLKFYIKLNETLTKQSNILAVFYNGNSRVSNFVTIALVRNITSYQNISINLSDFGFTSASFDTLRIIFTGTVFSIFPDFYLDYIQLQGVPGSTTIVNVQDATTTSKGILKLAGDLAGTSEAPTVPGLATKADLVAGKIPSSQLPSYVDDVIEGTYVDTTTFEVAGVAITIEAGKIYIDTATNNEYRWSGSALIQIVASPGSTDAVPEGATNKYFTVARVLATLLTGLSVATGGDIISTDSILVAFGKIQKRFNDLLTNFNGANQLVKLDGSATPKLPPVDGSQLVNLPSSGGGGSSVGTAAGTNTYTVSCTPAVTALNVGLCVRILFTNGNTGASTINVDGLGVKNIYTGPSTALIAGKISANTIYELYYDGTVWQLGSVQVVPTTPNKIVSTDSTGKLVANTDVIDVNSTTTEATLLAANWSTGVATVTGKGGTWVYGADYAFLCTADNTWRRILWNLSVIDKYLADTDDSGGVKTGGQMSAAFPGVLPGQKSKGFAGFYEFISTLEWVYTPFTAI